MVILTMSSRHNSFWIKYYVNQAQSITVHAALQSYLADMSVPGALGDDENGELMRKAYSERIQEINSFYIGRELEQLLIISKDF